MRAAVFYGPGSITNEEVYCDFRYNPIETPSSYPERTEADVFLKVKACAVCGYDVRAYRNGHHKIALPVILGHEICGRINRDVTVNDLVSGQKSTPRKYNIKAGSRVVVLPIIPCLACVYCNFGLYNLCLNLKEIGSSINGGFAELVKIPQQVLKIGGLAPVPDNLSDEEAALLEPVACCLNGLHHISPLIRKNEQGSVAIIGDGPIGLLHLQLVKHLYDDANTAVIGRIPERLRQAKSMGADATITFADDADFDRILQKTLDLTNGIGFNVVIIATSNPVALNFGMKIASRNSRINIFAGMPKMTDPLIFPIDPNFLHYNQISITGSFSSTPYMLTEAIKLASQGKINLSKLVTHKYHLKDIIQAILDTEGYRGLRVVINSFH
jgi:L-iditol 2-dehydrogenase